MVKKVTHSILSPEEYSRTRFRTFIRRGLLWLSAGVIIFGFTFASLMFTQNEADKSLNATGTVLENVKCFGSGNVGQFSKIQFTASDSITYTFRSGCRSPYQVGDIMTVLYKADDPQNAETVEDHFGGTPVNLCFSIMGLIGIIKGVYLIWGALSALSEKSPKKNGT